VGEKNKEEGRNGTTKMKNEENKYARESKERRNKGGRKVEFLYFYVALFSRLTYIGNDSALGVSLNITVSYLKCFVFFQFTLMSVLA
jgi:hypothetical protein